MKKVHGNRTHGLTGGKLYKTYYHFRGRCNNPKNPNWTDYGGRGIRCLWKNVNVFLAEMQESYNEHIERFGKENTQIDRIDNNGDYCNANCRWVTRKEQMRNTRHNKLLTFRGETKCLKEWAEGSQIRYKTMYARMAKGWSIEKILTTPTRRWNSS